jgi:hypothetical protein
VVPLDIPAFACRSAAEPRVEIFITDQHGKCVDRDVNGNNGMAFLK